MLARVMLELFLRSGEKRLTGGEALPLGIAWGALLALTTETSESAQNQPMMTVVSVKLIGYRRKEEECFQFGDLELFEVELMIVDCKWYVGMYSKVEREEKATILGGFSFLPLWRLVPLTGLFLAPLFVALPLTLAKLIYT